MSTDTQTPSHSKDIIVLYHGYCTDGFGAAYAAWKKFGDTASYIPQERSNPAPDPVVFENKEVYILDYSFSEEKMLAYERVAQKLVVVDHHRSAESAVRRTLNHIFSLDRSGAYLAWELFHPNLPVPKLIKYISDSDIWSHTLPDWETIEAFIYSDTEDHFTFEHFTELENILESPLGYTHAKQVGVSLLSTSTKKIQHYTQAAELVTFEGKQVYAVNAPGEIKSKLGHELAKKTDSFALIFMYERGFWKCSMRSVEHFDVSKIAEKYGGGGHKNAAAFLLTAKFPLSLVLNEKEGVY